MNSRVAQVRADICQACPAPCGWRSCAEAHSDPCSACPIGRWGQWGACAQPSSMPPPASVADIRGLGDVVAIAAAPVGRALGLDPMRCGCNQRQERLNNAVPFRRDEGPGVVI